MFESCGSSRDKEAGWYPGMKRRNTGGETCGIVGTGEGSYKNRRGIQEEDGLVLKGRGEGSEQDSTMTHPQSAHTQGT